MASCTSNAVRQYFGCRYLWFRQSWMDSYLSWSLFFPRLHFKNKNLIVPWSVHWKHINSTSLGDILPIVLWDLRSPYLNIVVICLLLFQCLLKRLPPPPPRPVPIPRKQSCIIWVWWFYWPWYPGDSDALEAAQPLKRLSNLPSLSMMKPKKCELTLQHMILIAI
jgi:hypothetical protein